MWKAFHPLFPFAAEALPEGKAPFDSTLRGVPLLIALYNFVREHQNRWKQGSWWSYPAEKGDSLVISENNAYIPKSIRDALEAGKAIPTSECEIGIGDCHACGTSFCMAGWICHTCGFGDHYGNAIIKMLADGSDPDRRMFYRTVYGTIALNWTFAADKFMDRGRELLDIPKTDAVWLFDSHRSLLEMEHYVKVKRMGFHVSSGLDMDGFDASGEYKLPGRRSGNHRDDTCYTTYVEEKVKLNEYLHGKTEPEEIY